jgi:hypothetical protein
LKVLAHELLMSKVYILTLRELGTAIATLIASVHN